MIGNVDDSSFYCLGTYKHLCVRVHTFIYAITGPIEPANE